MLANHVTILLSYVFGNSAMNCPKCGGDTVVKDSRPVDNKQSIKRKRECSKCSYKFVTLEMCQTKELNVVKKNGDKRIFDKQKLHKSVEVALRKRHFSQEDIESIVSSIIAKIEEKFDTEITTEEIGSIVIEKLYDTDKVAYIRFASVYHNFQDVNDFVNFINKGNDL